MFVRAVELADWRTTSGSSPEIVCATLATHAQSTAAARASGRVGLLTNCIYLIVSFPQSGATHRQFEHCLRSAHFVSITVVQVTQQPSASRIKPQHRECCLLLRLWLASLFRCSSSTRACCVHRTPKHATSGARAWLWNANNATCASACVLRDCAC